VGRLEKFVKRFSKIPIVGQGKYVRVFMPSYPGPKIQSVNCLVETVHHFQNHWPMNVVMRLAGSAYLNSLQNEAIAQMIDEEDCVGLLLAEHDAIWPPPQPARVAEDGTHRPPFNALQRLMSRDKDIVAGFATNRTQPVKMMAGWFLPNGDLRGVDDPKIVDPQNGQPFEVDWAATHFMYISRPAAVRIAEHAGSHLTLFDPATKLFSREDLERRVKNLLNCYQREGCSYEILCKDLEGLINLAGSYQNDISFCRRAKAAGCEIWVDPSFEVQHMGDYPYSRNDWIGQHMVSLDEAEAFASKQG
jgi:hypothetical protein